MAASLRLSAGRAHNGLDVSIVQISPLLAATAKRVWPAPVGDKSAQRAGSPGETTRRPSVRAHLDRRHRVRVRGHDQAPRNQTKQPTDQRTLDGHLTAVLGRLHYGLVVAQYESRCVIRNWWEMPWRTFPAVDELQ